jgi:hypothetical protein
MNLCMDVLRLLTVQALRGRTWCANRVYDSPGEPADLRAAKERQPYIAVYIDDGDCEMQKEQGTAKPTLYCDEPQCTLIVEVTVAGQTDDVPGAPDDNDLVAEQADPNIIANTDAGLEIRIGLIMRQVVDALSAPDNPWSELWRTLATDFIKVENRRGGSGLEKDEEAVRNASRVMRLQVGLLSEPAPGPLLPFWQKFLDMADQDERVAGISGIIRQILQPKDVQQWRAIQRAGSMTEDTVRGLGLGPVFADFYETPLKADNTGVSFIQDPPSDD